MSKKVEQLVMGAFYEAANEIRGDSGYQYMRPELVQEHYALHLAKLIRTRGLELYELEKLKEGFADAKAGIAREANDAASLLEAWADWARDWLREKDESAAAEAEGYFRRHAAELRKRAQAL
jgi:hypothetical protein